MRPTFTIFVPNYRDCSIMQRLPVIVLCLLLLAVLSCRKDDDHTLASCWAQESQNYLKNDRLDSAVLLNFKILENIDTTCSNNFAIIASTYNDLGDIFYKAAIFDRAMRMYARSIMAICSKTKPKSREQDVAYGDAVMCLNCPTKTRR